jgi:hypothetical protein
VKQRLVVVVGMLDRFATHVPPALPDENGAAGRKFTHFAVTSIGRRVRTTLRFYLLGGDSSSQPWKRHWP